MGLSCDFAESSAHRARRRPHCWHSGAAQALPLTPLHHPSPRTSFCDPPRSRWAAPPPAPVCNATYERAWHAGETIVKIPVGWAAPMLFRSGKCLLSSEAPIVYKLQQVHDRSCNEVSTRDKPVFGQTSGGSQGKLVAQGGRFHRRGGRPKRITRRCSANRSPPRTSSSASAVSATCEPQIYMCTQTHALGR